VSIWTIPSYRQVVKGIALLIETGICARNILQVANKTPYNTKGKTRSMAGGYIWVFESEVKK
jgi:hypothetical protein